MTRDNLTTVTSLYCVQILEMIRHKKSFHRALCHIPHRMEVKGRDSGSRALQQGRFLPTWGRVFSKFVLQIHRLICETVQSCICVKWAATHVLSLQFLYFCSALVFLHAVHCCICVSVPGGWYAVRCFKTRGRGVMCTSVGSTSKNSRPRPCCRRSLQHCAAMIPFDAAEKKVTGGAWFDILLNYLLAGLSKVEFRSFCRPQG